MAVLTTSSMVNHQLLRGLPITCGSIRCFIGVPIQAISSTYNYYHTGQPNRMNNKWSYRVNEQQAGNDNETTAADGSFT